MKKFFIFAGIACMAFASCQKTESVAVSNDNQEIAITAFNKVMTKGFADDATFTDRPYSDLISQSATKTDRDLILSAYDTKIGQDYFIGKTFVKRADKKWQGKEAPIYYPLGGNELEFLAYSVKDSDPAATWDGAKKVTLQVTEESEKDDILYAAAKSTAASQEADTDKAVPMTFNHAQAWITVKLNSNLETNTDIFSVDKLTWKNIFNTGELIIEYGAPATASWNFFTQVSKDVVMPDENRTNKFVVKDNSDQQLDMLIPEQNTADLVINYTLGGQKFEYTIKAEDLKADTTPIAKFDMGTHYTIAINFTITEITINPVVTAYVNVNADAINL